MQPPALDLRGLVLAAREALRLSPPCACHSRSSGAFPAGRLAGLCSAFRRDARALLPGELDDAVVEALRCGVHRLLELRRDQPVRATQEPLGGPVELLRGDDRRACSPVGRVRLLELEGTASLAPSNLAPSRARGSRSGVSSSSENATSIRACASLLSPPGRPARARRVRAGGAARSARRSSCVGRPPAPAPRRAPARARRGAAVSPPAPARTSSTRRRCAGDERGRRRRTRRPSCCPAARRSRWARSEGRWFPRHGVSSSAVPVLPATVDAGDRRRRAGAVAHDPDHQLLDRARDAARRHAHAAGLPRRP